MKRFVYILNHIRWVNVFLYSMILIMFLCMVGMGIVSCSTNNTSTPTQKELSDKSVFLSDTITIDGCQYFVIHGSYSYNQLVHKGNCNNPIHYQKIKELSRKVDSLIRVINNSHFKYNTYKK